MTDTRNIKDAEALLGEIMQRFVLKRTSTGGSPWHVTIANAGDYDSESAAAVYDFMLDWLVRHEETLHKIAALPAAPAAPVETPWTGALEVRLADDRSCHELVATADPDPIVATGMSRQEATFIAELVNATVRPTPAQTGLREAAWNMLATLDAEGFDGERRVLTSARERLRAALGDEHSAAGEGA